MSLSSLVRLANSPARLVRGACAFALLAWAVPAIPARAATPVPMSSNLTYTETFADIANWTNGFTSGVGANRFGAVAVNAGTIPSATAITVSSATFSTTTTGGVQKGTGNLLFLSTGATNNTNSVAADFFMDFTGTNAGNLSFDWAEVNNSTGDRVGALRVYASTDGTNWTELAGALVTVINNVASSGSVNVALPASFNNSATARLRFYNHNAAGGTTGSRPKISVDNLRVTAALNTFTITASAGANGTVSPLGATTVALNASQAYTITPNPGYLVQDVLVDGASVGAVGSYTFTNVTANHTLSASFAPDPVSTVSAVSPGGTVTLTGPPVSVPVTLVRGSTTPMLGFSVKFTLSGGLTTTPGAITEGSFLTASGATTYFQVTDRGNGQYTVDGVTLGLPCGTSATSGTLFSVAVGSTSAGGSGTLTIDSVTLRDCANAALPSAVGTAATVAVDRSAPAVAVTSPNGGESWVSGSSHAITWTASDPEGVAAGGVSLEYSVDDGASWLPVASGLANSGSFSWSVPAARTGSARVRVTALDTHGNAGVDASDAAFTIQAASTTSLAAAPNPSVRGQAVTLTATVSPALASGSMEFRDGATLLGTVALAGGTAVLATSALATGSHALTAVYLGDALDAGATSSVVTQVVNPAATTTTLASAPDPSVLGESVTLTATVAVSAPGAGVAGGTVTFFDGATPLGSVSLAGGTAAISVSSLAVGSHALSAVYGGSTDFTGSTSSAVTQAVNAAATTTALSAAPNPSVSGESVTLTATVAVVAPGAGVAGGTVTFYDGATPVGSATLAGGSAAIGVSSLAVGSHALTVVYGGSSDFTGSTSSAVAQVVNPAATTTTLATAPDPSVSGESVTLTATVAVLAPGAGVAGGTVTFYDGATPVGSATLAGGSAAVSVSSLAVGSHALTAVYGGSSDFTGSTSAAVTQVVNAAATTTTLVAAPNPSALGQSVTLTATVAVVAPGAGTAGGTVTFYDGATPLGSSSLVGGSAAISVSSLATGSHPLTAVYAGSPDFTGSTSAAVTQVVDPAATTTTLAAAPDPSAFGESVTLTATVAVVAPGAGTASGTVTFYDGATPVGSATLAGGTAAISVSSLATGSHPLTAVYAGNSSFTGSTSAAVTQVVDPAATTTTLAAAPNPSVTGEPVTLTATVAVVAPGAGTPGGSVSFYDGATPLGSATLAGGSAAISVSSLAVGSHALTAVYAGSPDFTGSTSSAVTQGVDPAATATTLATAPNPSAFGQSVTLTATVAVLAPGAGVASGTVTFYDGATPLGSASLASGSAAISVASFAVGSHPLTAVYAGSPDFTASTSSVVTQSVGQAATATALATAPNPSVFGEGVTLTATVSPASATGTVTFYDGATPLGSASVAGGTAAIGVSSLTVGSHALTAAYSGDGTYISSISAAVAQVVNAATTSTSLASAPNPSFFGQSVALTATVAVTAPGAGPATGTVTFFDGASPLGTASLSGGVAALSVSSLAVGSHSLTAVYAGDAGRSGSTSAAVTQVVQSTSSTTTLAASPNPSVFGQAVSLSATVSPAGTTGSVTFYDGATPLGSAPLSGGTAGLSVSSLAVGSHSLTAVYSGDATYTGSTSPVVAQVVDPAATTTTLAAAPNPSVTGQPVTLTASVTAVAPGAGTPGGTVTFYDGATPLGSASLSGGEAALAVSSLTAGSHSLTAVYGGEASFSGSTSAVVTQAVDPAATATTLAAAPNPSIAGQPVTLTAMVATLPPGAGTATGSVEFRDGATSLGSAPLVGGAASLAVSTLAVGSHSLTAVYAGDAGFSGSTSAPVSQTVDPIATSTTLASAPNPSTFGQSVTLTATVAPAGATGSVQFFDGATPLGSAALAAGSATFVTSAFAAGTHSLTAVYAGDATHSGSTSAAIAHVVNAAGTSVALVASPSPGVSLDPETLTATVSPALATGSVAFFDGATPLGSAPVSGGSAALVLSTLAVGPHSLTAVYSGDADHTGATSPAVALDILARITASAGPNGSVTPSGAVLVSLGATPSFAFAADPGYHVASVTVDGAPAPLTSPYTFAPVSANHTLDVQFAVNPPVAAISTLAATQVRSGNDADGTTRITLAWTAVPAGSTVEVWRRGFGNYPEYDDGDTPGSVPSSPASYPPAGWTLTTVASPGQSDEPATRDFWYYVAYVVDGYGTRSAPSNLTSGTLNYHLGDVSDGATVGQGDNLVTSADLSLLGAHYGISGAAVLPYGFLDVGPTLDMSVNSRPTTDNRLDFEDLVMNALNFVPAASAPAARARPAAAASDALALRVPSALPEAGGDLAVRLDFTGTGLVQALSVRLTWDPAVVTPVSWTAGDAALAQGALLLSPAPGTVDGASLAGPGQGLAGEGEFATIHFRVLGPGAPGIAFAKVDARDGQNHGVTIGTGTLGVSPREFATAFAPAMPNPFARSTTFRFTLAREGRAGLDVFSVDGRRVRTLADGMHAAGEHVLEWNGTATDGRPLPAGVYYARLVTPQGRFTRVVTLLR